MSRLSYKTEGFNSLSMRYASLALRTLSRLDLMSSRGISSMSKALWSLEKNVLKLWWVKNCSFVCRLWYVQKGPVKMIKQTNIKVLFKDSKQGPQTSRESVTIERAAAWLRGRVDAWVLVTQSFPLLRTRRRVAVCNL